MSTRSSGCILREDRPAAKVATPTQRGRTTTTLRRPVVAGRNNGIVSKARVVFLIFTAVLASRVGFGSGAAVGSQSAGRSPLGDPIQLLGDGLGSIRFGTNEAHAVSQLNAFFGIKRGVLWAEKGVLHEMSGDDCHLDAVWAVPELSVYFSGQHFVGYTTRYLRLVATQIQAGIHAEFQGDGGLRLTDTVRQARLLYGGAFKVYGARGGSWSVATRSGTLTGSLLSPPALTGLSDQIDRISAGNIGYC